jgi:hypothetical protein
MWQRLMGRVGRHKERDATKRMVSERDDMGVIEAAVARGEAPEDRPEVSAATRNWIKDPKAASGKEPPPVPNEWGRPVSGPDDVVYARESIVVPPEHSTAPRAAESAAAADQHHFASILAAATIGQSHPATPRGPRLLHHRTRMARRPARVPEALVLRKEIEVLPNPVSDVVASPFTATVPSAAAISTRDESVPINADQILRDLRVASDEAARAREAAKKRMVDIDLATTTAARLRGVWTNLGFPMEYQVDDFGMPTDDSLRGSVPRSSQNPAMLLMALREVAEVMRGSHDFTAGGVASRMVETFGALAHRYGAPEEDVLHTIEKSPLQPAVENSAELAHNMTTADLWAALDECNALQESLAEALKGAAVTYVDRSEASLAAAKKVEAETIKFHGDNYLLVNRLTGFRNSLYASLSVLGILYASIFATIDQVSELTIRVRTTSCASASFVSDSGRCYNDINPVAIAVLAIFSLVLAVQFVCVIWERVGVLIYNVSVLSVWPKRKTV